MQEATTIARIQEADLHITTECSSHCPYCYVDPNEEYPPGTLFKKCEDVGDTALLKRIISALRRVAGIEDLVLVGGDPCRHGDLIELLRYAKEQQDLNTCVLSNTHIYRDCGQILPIEGVIPLLDEIDFTLHGANKEIHDAFNRTPGSYEAATNQIKKFIKGRSFHHSVGIVLNMVPTTIGTPELLRTIMVNIIEELGMSPVQDFFTIQRIAPSGKALMAWHKWKITSKMLTDAFDVFDEIKDRYGFETKVCIDAIPWCALPERHWHYLEPLTGGCNWGKSGGVLSVLPDGTLQRCALCQNDLGVNILDLKNQYAFTKFLQNNPALYLARKREHLWPECLKCKLFEKCGGGCIVSSSDGTSYGDPYGAHPYLPRRGMDYLATGF